MPSIIEGYNYDIFISYRQKDNKGDKWVSEFVDSLKTELESTFKEEISVYFDINPHDGLLETHDVDESLKEKLKCLIFIPIISRTYCDPKSFAWEHEFKAFVEQASKDQFGLKVKLPNGNVASRVLPVRIHDLDIADIKECESVLGGVLRGIEFIYKESGVNRSLSSKDKDEKNLTKTSYRNQINKVALSIKEVILGLRAESDTSIEIKTYHRDSLKEVYEEGRQLERQKPVTSNNRKVLYGATILAILIIAAILTFPEILEKDQFENIRDSTGKISIAVIPFENLTGDTTLNWFQKGISSLIINGLGNSSELTVCDDQTMFEVMESMNHVYTAGVSTSLARDVANKAKVETYISGSFQGREDTYWILANLVSTETGNIMWTNKVKGNLKSSGYMELADSLCNEIRNYLEIKALEDKTDYDFREAYPKSAEAYRYFIEGMNLVLNQDFGSGIQSLKKSLEIDSTFAFASFYIAFALNYLGQAEAELWINKTYLHKDRIPQKFKLWIELWYACYNSKNIQDLSRYCDLLAESGINTRLFWSDLGVTYFDFLHQYEKTVNAYEKVMEISLERGDDWKFLRFWDNFLYALHKTGNHKRENEISDIGMKVLPDNSNWFYYRMAVCALSRGNTSEARDILAKYSAKHKELGTPGYSFELYLGQMYEEANRMDQAEIHFRKSYELNPQNLNLIVRLAQFLINNDINVGEGMDLIHNVLAIQPGNAFALELEGWGLYKQGKFKEAAEHLEKLWVKSAGFNYGLYSHLEAAKKALANLKNN